MKSIKKFLIILSIFLFLSFINSDFFLYFFIILIIFILFIFFKNANMNYSASNNQKIDKLDDNKYNSLPSYYEIKPFLTQSEYVFYQKLLNLSGDYIVIPQIPLSSIIKKVNGKYQYELNRVIDFGLFDKNFNLLLLIELNDSTHKQINRRDRDLKVKKILDDCYIKLITFYTCYPNEQDYINNRIYKELKLEDRF